MSSSDQALAQVDAQTERLQSQLQRTLERKNQIRVDTDTRVTGVEESLRELREKLHRRRVVVKRKEYALKVRQRRLTTIPKEIKIIEKQRDTEAAVVAQLEAKEAQLQQHLEQVKQRVANELATEMVIRIPA